MDAGFFNSHFLYFVGEKVFCLLSPYDADLYKSFETSVGSFGTQKQPQKILLLLVRNAFPLALHTDTHF